MIIVIKKKNISRILAVFQRFSDILIKSNFIVEMFGELMLSDYLIQKLPKFKCKELFSVDYTDFIIIYRLQIKALSLGFQKFLPLH